MYGGQPDSLEIRSNVSQSGTRSQASSSRWVRMLTVSNENDKVIVGHAYDKLVPIYGPVYLLINYEGWSR